MSETKTFILTFITGVAITLGLIFAINSIQNRQTKVQASPVGTVQVTDVPNHIHKTYHHAQVRILNDNCQGSLSSRIEILHNNKNTVLSNNAQIEFKRSVNHSEQSW